MRLLVVLVGITAALEAFLPPKPSRAECDCMGQTTIKTKKRRALTDNAELNKRLMKCDTDKEDCGKCCDGAAAYKNQGCKQGAPCQTECKAAHQDCEREAED